MSTPAEYLRWRLSGPRPSIVSDQHLAVLDALAEIDTRLNFYAAAVYLHERYNLSRADVRLVLSYWRDSFEQRRAA